MDGSEIHQGPAGPPGPAGPVGPAGPPGPAAQSSATDFTSKSFDFAADATKQLITVATGVVTATVIFSKDFNSYGRNWALAAWIGFSVSVLFGLSALFSMSGQLAKSKTPDIYAKKSGIRKLSGGQIVTFLIGMGLMVVFGFKALRTGTPPDPKPLTVNCVVQNQQQVAPPPPVVKNPASEPKNGRKTKSGVKPAR
ncbi:MAG: hypothetical protein WBQ95_19420 [Terracidiphilus sp.]